ncbi:MAG: kynurenine 3-monooxygenase [Mariniblastus sp.]
MKHPKSITISGAGLVGSLLAVLLGKRGYAVTILERRSDPRGDESDSGRSINLALSSRGMHALKLAGLMEEVEKLMIPMRGRMLHLEGGTEEFSPYGQRPNEVIYSVSRRDLNHLMMNSAEEAAPVNVVFDQILESVDFEGNELSIRNAVTDEVSLQPFEILIGCDGAGSRTRRAMLSDSGGESTSVFLDHDYKELEIPGGPTDSNGHPTYKVEREALHIWPRGGYMLIALPNQDGSFTVTLFMPKTGENSFESLTDRESLHDFFAKNFPSALALIPDLKSDFFANDQGRLGTVRCSQWVHKGKALIIGDASHAIVPFHGQGMNAGFEDCSELIRLLDEFDEDWSRVLPEFERIRKPNANAIADMALENYVTMRASVADPKFRLKKLVGFELEKRFSDRFVPRYSMVMFHLIPYSEAFARGEVQNAILNQLVDGVSEFEDVDFEKAQQLVLARLSIANLESPV